MNPLKTASNSHEAGSKSLARDAINEAELELAAWKTASQATARRDAFQRDSRGLRPGFEALAFPAREAAEFLRSRVVAYSVSLVMSETLSLSRKVDIPDYERYLHRV